MTRVPGIVYHANGAIAVDQRPINGWRITYNPDNELFCLHGADMAIVAAYNVLRNARTAARRRPAPAYIADKYLSRGADNELA